MKKLNLKIGFVLSMFLLVNVSVQTNVSAVNQSNQNDATTSMTNNDLFNLKEELKNDPTELSNIGAIENTNGVNEETATLLPVKKIEENEPSKGQKPLVTEEESHSNEVKESEVAKTEATEEVNALVSEKDSSSDEYLEDNEVIDGMAETEEETIIIDEEEFSPIIGLPSVKEEIEIEYTNENEVEEKVAEKKKPIVPVEKVISNEEQQFEMKILPQTSSNTSDFSEIGYLVTLLAAVFFVSCRR